MIPVSSYSSLNQKKTFRGINYKSNSKARSVTTAKATPWVKSINSIDCSRNLNYAAFALKCDGKQ